MTCICLAGDVLAPSGYASALRDHIKALIIHGKMKPGQEITIEQHNHDKLNRASLDSWWKEHLPILVRPNKPTLKVHYETPEFFKFNDIPVIGYTYWETSRILNTNYNNRPEFNWVNQMNQCATMYTACNYAAQSFKDSGVTVPISVFPWPINPIFLEDVEVLS